MFKKFIADMLNQVNSMLNVLNGKNIDESIEENSNIKDDPVDIEDLKAKLENHKVDYDKRMEHERNSYKRQVEELREKILSMTNEIDEFLDLYNCCLSCLNYNEIKYIDENIISFNIKIRISTKDFATKIEVSKNGTYHLLLIKYSDGTYSFGEDVDLAMLKKFYNNFPKMKKSFISTVNEIL